jgi:hypothetical protein
MTDYFGSGSTRIFLAAKADQLIDSEKFWMDRDPGKAAGDQVSYFFRKQIVFETIDQKKER